MPVALLNGLRVTYTFTASTTVEYATLRAWVDWVLATNPGVYEHTLHPNKRECTLTGTQTVLLEVPDL